MDINFLEYCRKLPKVELHAHLNGSLSQSTMLKLKRLYADSNIKDTSNVFIDEFQIGAGDTRSLNECFQVFAIAHTLTSTPLSLTTATLQTLEEFQNDGCVYIELRSTPKQTAFMNRREYIETLIQAIINSRSTLKIESRLILSVDRASKLSDADEIITLAIEYHKLHPDVLVGVELSGNPCVNAFSDFKPYFESARSCGLKVTLHCGEVCNPKEIIEMLDFKPDRIGHGSCIHPRLRGTSETWDKLCETKIPVEVCLTSNLRCKIVSEYEDHHFKELYEAKLPLVLCTDDKGVFETSLSQEYRQCAEAFNLTERQLAQISLDACDYVFDDSVKGVLKNIVGEFMKK